MLPTVPPLMLAVTIVLVFVDEAITSGVESPLIVSAVTVIVLIVTPDGNQLCQSRL